MNENINNELTIKTAVADSLNNAETWPFMEKLIVFISDEYHASIVQQCFSDHAGEVHGMALDQSAEGL